MRLFFALWPPAATVAALAAWAEEAQKQTGGRLTRPESIHLTLAFLGEVAEERVENAIRAAKSVRGERHALPIEHARVWSHNHVAWVGPKQTPAALESVVQSLRAQLRSEGFVLESRPFAAHLTLVRKAKRPTRLPPLPQVEWPVDEFTLVRSSLSRNGSTYEVIARFPIGSR